MCGFVGFWQFHQRKTHDLKTIAINMSQQIIHRGPDSSGVWQAKDQAMVMAHRRLAIRDLSPHGAQPMHSRCQRWTIAYNGEIYNTKELKKELQAAGVHVEEQCDTEILINAIACWGIDKALAKLNGMFAFAAWDSQQQQLYLARDRMGIKPLYWGIHNGVLYFGSQLKAFAPHPQWSPEINREALASYFRFNYIPGPMTIYHQFEKLVSGEYVNVDRDGQVRRQRYWSLLTASAATHQHLPEAGVIENTHLLLKDAVAKRMVADVPLGAFLSGGIDSSAVVALMQAQSSRPVLTFSIGFSEAEFNEAHYAKQVAQHLGTDHHELYLSARDSMDLIPQLSQWYDEPFADSSQLPTLLVSKLARQHVTVSLSGDGGDELYAGYTRYFTARRIYRHLSYLPKPMRAVVAKAILAIRPQVWDGLARGLPRRYFPRQLGDKAHKFARLLPGTSQEFYRRLVSLWPNPEQLLLEGHETYQWPQVSDADGIKEMQMLDALTYLPDDILTKVDRASMAVSLEARVPLLDHRVVEQAFSLPQSYKVRGRCGKWILRQILGQYIPANLIDRPKMGFGVPIGDWLRGPLREWADDLLTKDKLESFGLNVEMIQKTWHEHLAGSRNWQYPLWGVLMLQDWRSNLTVKSNREVASVAQD